jgi:8-oxoguanine DNA glycosylase, N-terminal domain
VLDNTLPTGQSFRWRPTSPGVYTGVVGQRVVQLRQLPSDVEWRVLARGPSADADGDAAALRDYLNLETSLTALAEGWAAADARFAALAPHLPGCRMLRQDPVETLFSFICSSNNHIRHEAYLSYVSLLRCTQRRKLTLAARSLSHALYIHTTHSTIALGGQCRGPCACCPLSQTISHLLLPL